jgi:hypothetical protein
MSLAQILYPAPTKHGFEEWAYQHYIHHQTIIDAIRTKKNLQLQLYPIYPFSLNNSSNWLEQHQAMHTAMDGVYKVIGADLSVVDFNSKPQMDAWFYLNYIEHRSVAQATGLAI